MNWNASVSVPFSSLSVKSRSACFVSSVRTSRKCGKAALHKTPPSSHVNVHVLNPSNLSTAYKLILFINRWRVHFSVFFVYMYLINILHPLLFAKMLFDNKSWACLSTSLGKTLASTKGLTLAKLYLWAKSSKLHSVPLVITYRKTILIVITLSSNLYY